jgi:hypothetical protein
MTFELCRVSVGMSHTPFTDERNARSDLVKLAPHQRPYYSQDTAMIVCLIWWILEAIAWS